MVTQREREKVASSDDSVRSKINTNSIFDSSAPSASAPLPSIINIVRVFLKKDEEREASKDVWWSFQSVCLFVPLSFHSSLAINHSKKKGKFSFFLRSTWNPTGERYRTWEKAGQVLRTRESNRNSRSRAAPPVSLFGHLIITYHGTHWANRITARLSPSAVTLLYLLKVFPPYKINTNAFSFFEIIPRNTIYWLTGSQLYGRNFISFARGWARHSGVANARPRWEKEYSLVFLIFLFGRRKKKE